MTKCKTGRAEKSAHPKNTNINKQTKYYIIMKTYLSIHDICNNQMEDNLREIETIMQSVINREFADYIEATDRIEYAQIICNESLVFINSGMTRDDDNILTDIFKSYDQIFEAYKSMLFLMNSGA